MPEPEAGRASRAAPSVVRMTPAEVCGRAREVALEPLRQARERVESPSLAAILSHIEEHLFDGDLSISRLRRKGPFPAEAWASFSRELGMDPKAYTLDRKLSGAAWLLRRTDLQVLFVADFAGYAGTSSFDNAFSKWAGCVPSQYRESMQSADVIEVVVDEMESDEFWWKTIFQLLKPAQVKRLLDRFVKWYPSLKPRPAVREKTWRLDTRGFERPELVYQAVWRAMKRLPSELRLELIRKAISCDSTRDFFHFLCQKSLVAGRTDPDRGIEVMELALEFLRSSANELGNELQQLKALALARLANACRLASDFVSAREYLVAAHETWKGAEGKDDLVEAEIVAYEANVHLFEGQLDQAEFLLDKAIGLCEVKPPGRLLAQCLIQRATVVGYSGAWHAAIGDLHTAEVVLAHQAEPRLKLTVAGNLALFHVLANRVDEAGVHLTRAWELCAEIGDESSRHHLSWTAGLIDRADGDLDKAVVEFEKARVGFKRAGQPGYHAVVAVELALVRYEQQRFEEVVSLVATAIPVLEHFQHVASASIALSMLCKAVAAHQITREMLEAVHRQLYTLWQDPTLDLGAVGTGEGPGAARPFDLSS